MKVSCDKCEKMAVWMYMPGGNNYCDDHISRGCSCNLDFETDEPMLDEQGREYPCCEYDYIEEGWEDTTDFKVYLDDLRDHPEGWVRTYTVEETVDLLKERVVTHLSLDNDLGEGLKEGWEVLTWLEETVYNDVTFPIPMITIHSANATRVEYMKRAVLSIERIRQQQVGGA